jgi:hypothetical protein
MSSFIDIGLGPAHYKMQKRFEFMLAYCSSLGGSAVCASALLAHTPYLPPLLQRAQRPAGWHVSN